MRSNVYLNPKSANFFALLESNTFIKLFSMHSPTFAKLFTFASTFLTALAFRATTFTCHKSILLYLFALLSFSRLCSFDSVITVSPDSSAVGLPPSLSNPPLLMVFELTKGRVNILEPTPRIESSR